MKKSRILIVAVAMIMVMTMFAACGNETTASADDESLKRVQDKGELVLGCDIHFPPMGFDDNGTVVGFDIDLAEAVAEKLGVKLVAKPIDWTAKEMELQSGKIDVIWNGYTINKDRNGKVEFTKPYLNNAQMLVTKADSDIKSVKDLEGKTIGYQSDSAAQDIFDGSDEIKNAVDNSQMYDDYQKALLDLKTASRIDAVICDKVLIEYAMKQEPGVFAICEEPLGTEYFGIGCPQGATALAQAIDKAIDELNEDGTIDEICAKWFGGGNIVIRDVEKLTDKDF